jgi:hypothetical protein
MIAGQCPSGLLSGLPLRASRRPSSVKAALRSSGFRFTSRVTHSRSTRPGNGFR